MPDKKKARVFRHNPNKAKGQLNPKYKGITGSEIFLGGESDAYKKAMGDAHGFGERKPSRKKPRPAKATQQKARPASESVQKMSRHLRDLARKPRMPKVIPKFGKPNRTPYPREKENQ